MPPIEARVAIVGAGAAGLATAIFAARRRPELRIVALDGARKIGAKILEEAHELVEAAGEFGEQGRRHLVYEASDLVYHMLVLLSHHGIKLEELETEVSRRFGQSGLDEKASRTIVSAS